MHKILLEKIQQHKAFFYEAYPKQIDKIKDTLKEELKDLDLEQNRIFLFEYDNKYDDK